VNEALSSLGVVLAVVVILIAAVIFIGSVLGEHLAVKRQRARMFDDVEIEFRRAKSAMNEAAGQAWRNLAD
jgi:Na+-transporting methylmalonyl-CoA/oxaloacetate decarboxylase gamma subunit